MVQDHQSNTDPEMKSIFNLYDLRFGAIRSALMDLWQQGYLMSRLGNLPGVSNCTKPTTEVMANNFEKKEKKNMSA